jgi:endonuclease YncB( thermonuclease family)
MMPADNSLSQARALLRKQDRATARKVLSAHLRAAPDDLKAWMLLAEAVDTRADKRKALQRALAIAPDHGPALDALAALQPAWWSRLKFAFGLLVFGVLLPAITLGGLIFALDLGQSSAAQVETTPAALSAALDPAPAPLAEIKTFDAPLAISAMSDSETDPQQPEEIPLPDIPAAYCVPAGNQRQQAEVLAVTAPDTIAVVIAGEVVNVRYIGLDVAGLNDFIGAQALLTNQSLQGVTVTLVAGNEQPDGDGALRRYVFAGDYFINFQLLEWGLALVSEEGLDEDCAGFFLAAQNQAKAARIGQWAPVDVRMDPAVWQQWPVVPRISENALNIYRAGLALGNDPHRFTIYGDCQSLSWRLFQRLDWEDYDLGPDYAYLNPARDWFHGSFGRNPITTADSATVATMYSVLWADPDQCASGETPFDCEQRVYNPSIALITLGTNWKGTPAEWEYYLRKLVDESIAQGVLPILVTKVDGGPDWALNQVMARVAYEADIPLWNFWLAAQGLPNGGMDVDDPRGIHFVDEGFPIKRITGLMTLNAVLEANAQP